MPPLAIVPRVLPAKLSVKFLQLLAVVSQMQIFGSRMVQPAFLSKLRRHKIQKR